MKDKKPHIGIFGRRNVGKSSLINALTGTEIAIVSDIPGTTTDPVKKSMEIGGIGAVVLIDTAGIDDDEEHLGAKRIAKSYESIKHIDLAICVFTHNEWTKDDDALIENFERWEVPYFIVHNKSDQEELNRDVRRYIYDKYHATVVNFNNKQPDMIDALAEVIRSRIPAKAFQSQDLLDGLVAPKDIVLLVNPIDIGAPTGRMILPQVQTWRSVMDADCIMISCLPKDIPLVLNNLKQKPALIITDSQVFKPVNEQLPADIPLTSFSILLMRQKGYFKEALAGTQHIAKLKDGDKILVLEACSHQVSCEDIGRVKLPKMLMEFTKKQLVFEVKNATEIGAVHPKDYALVIQCGSCISTSKQMKNTLKPFIESYIPVSNYGMTIAYVNGIFDKATKIFK